MLSSCLFLWLGAAWFFWWGFMALHAYFGCVAVWLVWLQMLTLAGPGWTGLCFTVCGPTSITTGEVHVEMACVSSWHGRTAWTSQ